MANAYATEFVNYETCLALKSLTTAEVQLQQQINVIEQELAATAGTPQGTALANQEAVLKEQYAQYQVVRYPDHRGRHGCLPGVGAEGSELAQEDRDRL